MAWQDNIREAAYTSPSGERKTFVYENVSKSIDKKTTGFDFPDADGTYIQDLGHSGRKYPLKLIFWGSDCDSDADAFESLLLEKGQGILEHPFYGVINVVPYGSISRKDELVSGSNQAIIELTFWETTGLEYPAAQIDKKSTVIGGIETLKDNSSASFFEQLNLKKIEAVNLQKNTLLFINKVKDSLISSISYVDDLNTEFNVLYSEINSDIELLVNYPETLARKITNLVHIPSKAENDIYTRIEGYQSLIDEVLLTPILPERYANEFKNAFYLNDFVLCSIISAQANSLVNNTFNTQTDSVSYADLITTNFTAFTQWHDDNYVILELEDTGDNYNAMQELVAYVAGYLVDISFTLKREIKIIIDRDYSIINLCHKLYGDVDDNLDFFISTNDFSGSELIELKAGKEIVYYV